MLRNPVRESTNALTEIIVDSYLSNGLNHAGDTLFDKMSSIFAMQFKRNWEGSEDFREEVTCDFQALLCLLELPGFTGGLVTTQDIFYAVENALYVQNIIYVAKHIDEPITLADDFALRRTIIAHFAFMLEDGEFAELLNAALSKFNRFYVKGDCGHGCNGCFYPRHRPCRSPSGGAFRKAPPHLLHRSPYPLSLRPYPL